MSFASINVPIAERPGRALYPQRRRRRSRKPGIDGLNSRDMKSAAVMLTSVAVLAAVWPASARPDDAVIDDAAEAEQELSEIRTQIADVEKQIREQTAERGAAEKQLRAAERNEAGVRRKLAEITTALARTRERLGALEQEAAAIREDLSRHVVELELQLRAAFVSGRDDWLRAALSQRDPAEIGRQLVYHSYIARQRTELIDLVRADLDKLDETQQALDVENAKLEDAQGREQARLAELAEVRAQRKVAVADINAKISTRSDRVERLRGEAEELETLVAELTRILADLPIAGAEPFGDRKGKMEQPATGRVVRKFGASRADGRLRWDGILVGAAAGDEVRAVHYGRVVFSDWLPGMGLLVILEHGDGYLSLYGHNQDLVTEVGEWVDPGTVIAHVGDSGGQAMTGLYFEIRKNGSPQNPARWLAR